MPETRYPGLSIAYAGTLYLGRDLSPVVRAIRRFIDAHPNVEPPIKLRVAGNMDATLETRFRSEITGAGLDDLVEIHGPLPNAEAVLGSMYVVEGSTLGGAMIARDVENRLGLTAETGCAYFRSYGRNVAAMWKSFGAVLMEASSPEADDLIVGAAQDTFTVMHDWLCETP